VISFGNAWIGDADLYRRLSARKNERLRNGRLWREAAVRKIRLGIADRKGEGPHRWSSDGRCGGRIT